MSSTGGDHQLLVCIIKDHHQVEEILTGFLELGIRGATVIDGRGMGQILSTDVPIFAGFKNLFPGGSSGTYVLMSVVTEEVIEPAAALVNEVCEDLEQAGTGFLFTLPVGYVKGFAREIQ